MVISAHGTDNTEAEQLSWLSLVDRTKGFPIFGVASRLLENLLTGGYVVRLDYIYRVAYTQGSDTNYLKFIAFNGPPSSFNQLLVPPSVENHSSILTSFKGIGPTSATVRNHRNREHGLHFQVAFFVDRAQISYELLSVNETKTIQVVRGIGSYNQHCPAKSCTICYTSKPGRLNFLTKALTPA